MTLYSGGEHAAISTNLLTQYYVDHHFLAKGNNPVPGSLLCTSTAGERSDHGSPYAGAGLLSASQHRDAAAAAAAVLMLASTAGPTFGGQFRYNPYISSVY